MISTLDITLEQYNLICELWARQMISYPVPFIYGNQETNPEFRAWNPACLNNPICRKVLIEDVKVTNLPVFTEYEVPHASD